VIRHVAVFRWKPGTPESAVARVTEGLRALPGVVEGLRAYEVGPDLRLSEGQWDYAVVADFDDPEGFAAYRAHPAHVGVLEERILPILDARAAVQFEVGEAR
jgi:hypothetical protein